MQIHGQKLPGLPWTIVAAGAAILGYKLSGKGLALFAGIVMIYISIFGQWKPSCKLFLLYWLQHHFLLFLV